MLHFSTYDWRDVSPQIMRAWKEIVRCEDLNPSLLPDWLTIAAISQNKIHRLRLLVMRNRSSIIGVLPFFMNRKRMWGLPVNVLEFAYNIISYHQQIVAYEQHQSLLEALLDDQSIGDWDVFTATNVPHDTSTMTAIANHASRIHAALINYHGETSPTLEIHSAWTCFLQKKSRAFRYRQSRIARRNERAGAGIRWFTSEEDALELFECIQNIESKSRKRAANMAITQHGSELQYYRRLLPFLASSGMLFSNVLFLDSKPISYSLAYHWNARIGQLKTSFDEHYAKLSPGMLVTQSAIRKAHEIGAIEFDFLGNNMPHKMEWANMSRVHSSPFIFGSHPFVRLLGSAKGIVQTIKGFAKSQHKY